MIDDLLEKDKRGSLLRTIRNFITILENDPALKGHIYKDMLKGVICVRGGLPWNECAYQWTNDDDVDLRIYVETHYHFSL